MLRDKDMFKKICLTKAKDKIKLKQRQEDNNISVKENVNTSHRNSQRPLKKRKNYKKLDAKTRHQTKHV